MFFWAVPEGECEAAVHLLDVLVQYFGATAVLSAGGQSFVPRASGVFGGVGSFLSWLLGSTMPTVTMV